MLMDTMEICKIIPHRYPFLMIDMIEELELNKRVVAYKNVTMNEWYFQGHFPDNPIMPGVLVVEAMAQASGVLAIKSVNEGEGKMTTYFMAIEKAKFRKPVHPGDQLRLEVEVLRARKSVWKLSGKAYVEDNLVCESEFTAMITDKEI
jgi:beta-hydroxyacyl-ACP dehydratase FabZ